MAATHSVPVTDATFGQEVEQYKGLIIVDFWATWCGPCHMLAPILDHLPREYPGTLKVANEVEKYKGLMIVGFWATWCGPCHMVAPIMDTLARDYPGTITVTKIHLNHNQ